MAVEVLAEIYGAVEREPEESPVLDMKDRPEETPAAQEDTSFAVEDVLDTVLRTSSEGIPVVSVANTSGQAPHSANVVAVGNFPWRRQSCDRHDGRSLLLLERFPGNCLCRDSKTVGLSARPLLFAWGVEEGEGRISSLGTSSIQFYHWC